MRLLLVIFFAAMSVFNMHSTQADEYRPAYLELTQTDAYAYDMLWKVPAKNENTRLNLYVNFPESVKKISSVRSRFVAAAIIERSTIGRAGGLTGIKINISGLERLNTDVLVRIQRLDGSTETARLNASNTSFTVVGTPDLWQVVNTYLIFGVEHILEGFDHLLFIACLVFIAGSWKRVLITITGFTLAHSITLTLAALEFVRLPISPIEAVIALSIVFLAREIAVGRRDTITWRFPIVVSASFGLLHGFGFASALRDIGLPQTEIPAALIAFNLGVEIGQVLFIAALSVIAWLIKRMQQLTLFTFNTQMNENGAMVIERSMAYLIGVIAMYWTVERLAGFWA
jgi:hydrogenase/urease accessory protein HupE